MLETTFLKLKKWVLGDNVPAYYNAMNQNLDTIDASIGLFGDVHYATEMKNGNGSNSYVQFQLYAPAGFTARGAVWQFQCNGIVVPYSIVFNGDNFIASFSTPTGIAMPTNYAITLHIWFKKKAN